MEAEKGRNSLDVQCQTGINKMDTDPQRRSGDLPMVSMPSRTDRCEQR